MKKTICGVALALSVLAAPALASAAAVQRVLTFSGTLRTSSGAPETQYKDIVFRLYAVPSSGTALFSETIGVQPGTDGSFSVTIGGTTPLDAALFAQQLYLGIQVAGEAEMVPRTQLTPTPYTWAVDWAAIGGFPTSCAPGQFVTGLGPTLTCATPPQAVASVTGTGMISATTSSGAVSVSLSTAGCTTGQYLGYDGLTWGCQGLPATPPMTVSTDATLLGDGSSVAPLGLATCADGQVLKMAGTSWGCGADVDTDTGLTAITNDGTLVGDGTAGSPLGVFFEPASSSDGTGVASTAARTDHNHSVIVKLELSDAYTNMTAVFGSTSLPPFNVKSITLDAGGSAEWMRQLGYRGSLSPRTVVVSISTVSTASAVIPSVSVQAQVIPAGGGFATPCALGPVLFTSNPTSVTGANQSIQLKANFTIAAGCVPVDDSMLAIRISRDATSTEPLAILDAFAQIFF